MTARERDPQDASGPAGLTPDVERVAGAPAAGSREACDPLCHGRHVCACCGEGIPGHVVTELCDLCLSTPECCLTKSFNEGANQEAAKHADCCVDREELERANRVHERLEGVLVAGNHLASALVMLAGAGYPPFTATPDEGREWFYANLKPTITASWVQAYDVWIGWRAAMRVARTIDAPSSAESDEAASA